jgi:DNA gyrase/topoisomerase IV subunit A
VEAVENWDGVSARVYASEDRDAAIVELGKPPLSFSEIQSAHVIDMQQSRRTLLGRRRLREEREGHQREIEQLTR